MRYLLKIKYKNNRILTETYDKKEILEYILKDLNLENKEIKISIIK